MAKWLRRCAHSRSRMNQRLEARSLPGSCKLLLQHAGAVLEQQAKLPDLSGVFPFAARPPWPNGQGVGLLLRRLRARVPQGVQFLIHFSLRSVRRICSQKCCVYGFRRSLFGGSSPPPSPLRGGGLPSHIRQMVRPPGPTDWNPRRDHRLAVASCFASEAMPDVPRDCRTRQPS